MSTNSTSAASSVALLLLETIGKDIVCANKEKWQAAVQADIDQIPKIKIAKHLLYIGIQDLLNEVVSLCDCPTPAPPSA